MSLSASTVSLRILQLGVVLAKQEIIGGHHGNQGSLNDIASIDRGQQDGPRGFGGAAILSPEIDNVVELQGGGIEGGSAGVERRGVLVGDTEAAVQRGKLVGAGDSQIGAACKMRVAAMRMS